ncbi:MAG: PH domain-containing protein [Acidobacteriota bacterium]
MAEGHRLHGWSWIFLIGGMLRALLIPLIAAVFAGGDVLLIWLNWVSLAVLVPIAAIAAIYQRIYRYRFTAEALEVRDGLLTRNLRQIPYERIHNVALVRNPLHRLLGVATARIETGAGGGAEAQLRVLSLEAAEELRRQTLGEARLRQDEAAAAAGSADGPLVTTPDGELVRLGLISNRGFLVIAALAGVLSQSNGWETWITDQDWSTLYESAQEQGPTWLGGLGSIGAPGSWWGTLLLALGLFALLVVVIRVLSIVWYLVRYRNFTLQQIRDDLQIEYGLLTRVSSVVPTYRIQLVTVTESLLHRWFGRESVEVETAGNADGDGGASQQLATSGVKITRQWLAPIVRDGRSAALVRQVMPEIDLDTVQWNPIERRAVRRIVRRTAIFLAIPTAIAAAVPAFASVPFHSLHGLWILAIGLPVAWVSARGWVRNTAWAVTDAAVLYRSGWLGSTTSAVRFANMQTVSLTQSPFDRRHDMAQLTIDTAGAGSIGHRVAIPYMDARTASEVQRHLYAEGCATEFRW